MKVFFVEVRNKLVVGLSR